MRSSRSFRIRILSALVALPLAGLAAAPGTPAAAASPAAARWEPRAVALGDSFASGEGLSPYQKGTGADGGCHRSSQAYPSLLKSSGSRRFRGVTSVACSGATTGALVGLPSGGEPAQLRALSRRTKTVTLTIGGNDVGFAAVLRDCVYAPPPAPPGLVPGSPGCSARNNEDVDLATARLAGAAGTSAASGTLSMPQALRLIHRRSPGATIYVTGYPRLFGLTFPSLAGCPVGQLPLGGQQVPLFVSETDARWIRSKSDGLNAAIADSVARARKRGIRATYVNVAKAFNTHNVCGTGTPWLNGLVFDPTNPPSVATASFHPNASGQQAFADAVAAAATPRRGAGQR